MGKRSRKKDENGEGVGRRIDLGRRGNKGRGLATVGGPNARKAVIRASCKKGAISAPVQSGHIFRFLLRV